MARNYSFSSFSLQEDDVKGMTEGTQLPVLFMRSNKNYTIAAGGRIFINDVAKDYGLMLLQLMAIYYAFRLMYPLGSGVSLSLIQEDVLGDKMHKSDITTAYKKARESFTQY